jgi:microcystin-dependent protein
MSEPFLGEIRMVGFGFAPSGWAQCNGQLLPINQNQALFSILGTTYGGNGITNFALPELRDRVPISFGQGTGLDDYALGQTGGETAHLLTLDEWVNHSHALYGTRAPAETADPSSALPAVSGDTAPYSAGSPNAAMSASALGNANGGQSHENRQPFLTANFIIALQGIFPSRP